MTVMTHPAAVWSRAVPVPIFWSVAATLVVSARTWLTPRFALAGEIAAMVSVLAVAYCFTRFCEPESGINRVLGVGIVWLVLTIIAEGVVTTHLGRGWDGLLGSPEHPLVRNLFLFLWIFAPALFARREENQ